MNEIVEKEEEFVIDSIPEPENIEDVIILILVLQGHIMDIYIL